MVRSESNVLRTGARTPSRHRSSHTKARVVAQNGNLPDCGGALGRDGRRTRTPRIESLHEDGLQMRGSVARAYTAEEIPGGKEYRPHQTIWRGSARRACRI